MGTAWEPSHATTAMLKKECFYSYKVLCGQLGTLYYQYSKEGSFSKTSMTVCYMAEGVSGSKGKVNDLQGETSITNYTA